jgi:type IV secretion system protein VirB4
MSEFDNLTNLRSQDATNIVPLSEKALLKSYGKRAQNKKQLEEFRDIGDDVEESDFVPYACFYDQHTIITKNGELCQTIRITGSNAEQISDTIRSKDNDSELRKLIRKSIKDYIPNDSFAVWLHTIRRKVEVSENADFSSNNFADTMNQWWITSNNFSLQYVNEVYLTIVIEGQSSKIGTPQAFMRGLIPSVELKWRNQYIDSAHGILNDTTEKMLNILQEYGATRLGFVKEAGVYYSEQLRFLEKLINFVDRPMPVVDINLSEYLTGGEITFAFNAMEVRAYSGKRRFASIISLKEYKEASLKVLDQFLELPMEFVVTQSVNFINPQKVLEQFREVSMLHQFSRDQDIGRLSELSNIMASNNNRANDFGENQLTIFIISDSIDLLEDNVKKSVAFFAKYGMVAVREDLKFEETYWAQLPGNFVFVSRNERTYIEHVGGFTNLNKMPTGTRLGNRWGGAVTMIPTASGVPYHFNFHYKDSGHSCIIGNPNSGKKVLLHFLLTQSMRFKPYIYYFDVTGGNDALIYYLEGRNIDIAADAQQHNESGLGDPLFNPFALSDHPNNKQFLGRWLGVLARLNGYSSTAEEKDLIKQKIAEIYQYPLANRSLANFVAMLGDEAPAYRHALRIWLAGGKFAHVFNANGDGVLQGSKIYSFKMVQVLQEMPLLASVNSLLLQLISDKLNGEPTIIVLDEAWQLLSQTHIAPEIGSWLDFVTSKNAITINVIESIDEAAAHEHTAQLFKKCVTKIYMPDDEPTDAYYEVFGLDEYEMTYLEMMELRERHFMLKHGADVLIGEMRLGGMKQYLPILGGKVIDYDSEDLPEPNKLNSDGYKQAYKQVSVEEVLADSIVDEEDDDEEELAIEEKS